MTTLKSEPKFSASCNILQSQVLTSEEYFALFQIARNVLEPYRELCLELVAGMQ